MGSYLTHAMKHTPTATISPTSITSDATLANLAVSWAGAARVMQRHGLDFCCRGQQSVAAACAAKGLDAALVLDELRATTVAVVADTRWEQRSTEDLVQHVLDQ